MYSSSKSLLMKGNCVDLMDELPENSVQLILTDPPYHITKKKNIRGDTSFISDEQYLNWMREVASKWNRILAPNGTIYCFCASGIASRLEMVFQKYFNIIGTITWTKPNAPGYDGWKQKMNKSSLRGWYMHSEKIICMETRLEGNLMSSYFGQYLKNLRLKAKLTSKQLTAMIGAFGKINNGGAVSNWETGRNIPSKEQYIKITSALLSTNLVRNNEIFEYENVVRPFNVNREVEFTDVWTFENVRQSKGKHPAEKPTSILKHIINASSLPGDIVLDCFSGSGSTLYTALQMGRKSIGIELDDKWVDFQSKKINKAENTSEIFLNLDSKSNVSIGNDDDPLQLSLAA